MSAPQYLPLFRLQAALAWRPHLCVLSVPANPGKLPFAVTRAGVRP